jgi:hypothetical protein
LLFGLAFFSATLRVRILAVMRWLSDVIGRIATVCFLWPFYVVVFGMIHFVLALVKWDMEVIAPGCEASYWRPAAPESQRARHYDRLFTIEPPDYSSHWLAWILAALILSGGLAVASEVILRSMGFGNPIVYRIDPRIGYYPAPHQDVHRYGGNIHINDFGMRSRDVSAAKPAGTYRILMLGDSTLYGGSYIDQNQLYATRLEKLLNQYPDALPGAPRQVEILAMGVNGWGPEHEAAYARQFGLFDADLVMVMGPPDDAYRPLYGIEHFPFSAEGHKPRFAWQEFGIHILWEYRQRSAGSGETFSDQRSEKRVLDDGVRAWLEVADLARAAGAKSDFEFLPKEGEVQSGKADESTQQVLVQITPALEQRQVPWNYPIKFVGPQDVAKNVYHDGAHLAANGHEIYARCLRDRIVKWLSGK